MGQEQEKIVRSEGENETEKILSKICDDTFLKLWVYPNTYKKQADELCDVLVVFEKHIFIFSVKDIAFNNNKEIGVAWSRWKRKAIDGSIRQIERAESWIKKHPDKIFLDPQCSKKLPINLNLEGYKIHRVVVAHGAEEACRAYSENNIYGSLAIGYADPIPNRKNDSTSFPFLVELPREKVFHVFDSFNLNIVLGELDTIADLLPYFDAKEEAIQKYTALNYCGEEDLLAHYLCNFDTKQNRHFIGTKRKDISGIHVGEGEWYDFVKTEAYKRKKEADRISYFWDKLLQKTLQNVLDNAILGNADIFNGKSAIIEMAKEPRFHRRELSKAIWHSIKNIPDFEDGMGRNLSSFPSYYPDKRYVFLQLTPALDKDYDTEYRPLRRYMLSIACGMEKVIRPQSKKVVGIAIDAPKYVGTKNSEDFALLDCKNWSNEDEKYYRKENKHFNFFETGKVKERRETSYNFPPVKSNKPYPRNKTGRNEKCPCGSDKKYKYCHYRKDKGS